MIQIRSLALYCMSCAALVAMAEEQKTTEAQNVLQVLKEQRQFLQEQKYTIRKTAPLQFLGWTEFSTIDYAIKPLPTDYKADIKQTPEHKQITTYIETVFGKKGLACDQDLLKYIKQFYFYFEYLTRIEKAVKILSQAQQKKIDFSKIPAAEFWSQVLQKIGTFNFNVELTADDVKQWNGLLTGTQSLLFLGMQQNTNDYWSDIQTSSFWSIPVSADEMTNSIFWQDYLKFMITNSIYCDADYCQSKEGAAYNLVPHIQSIESSYYIPDFTYERHQYETAQLSLLLNDKIRNRLVGQCNDWKHFPVYGGKDNDDLINFAQDYKLSPLFQKFQILNDPKYQTAEKIDIGIFKSNSIFESQEVRLIGMAITLGFLIHDLFDDYKTAKQTVSKLSKIPAVNFVDNFPSLLVYRPSDGPYILDFAYLSERIATNAQQVADAQDLGQKLRSADVDQDAAKNTSTKIETNESETPVKPSSIFDDAGGFFESVTQTFEGWGKTLYADILSPSGMFANFGKLIYYQSGSAMVFQGVSWDECKDKAASAKSSLAANVHNLSTTCGDIIAKAATYTAVASTLPYAITLGAIGISDADVLKGTIGMYSKVGEAIGSYYGHMAELSGTAVILAGDGITFFSSIILQASTQNWKGFGETFLIFGQDIINATLQQLVIYVDLFKSEYDIIGKAIGYLIYTITSLIIDMSAGFGALFTGRSYSSVKADVAKHRRVISQGVGLALFIAAGVLTGGMGGAVGGALFMSTFALPSIASGAQQDAALEEAQQELNNFFRNYAITIQNQTQMTEELNNQYEEDIKSMYDAAWLNQRLAYGFNENEQIDALNSFECSEAYALGSYQAAQMMKDETTGYYKAEPGNLFKYFTGWLNLNPSQGIVLYEPGRSGVFAQEAAVKPAIVQQSDSDKSPDSVFWFLQNVVKTFKRSGPSNQYRETFEIRFKPLYLLNRFYIGMGIGGIPFDAEQVIKSGLANLDQYHHTKMVVFHKDNRTGQNTNIGVYEHESDINTTGWLTTTNWKEPALEPGEWYRLKIDLPLNGKTLTFKAWKETDPKNILLDNSISVTKLEDCDPVVNRSLCPTQTSPDCTNKKPLDIQLMVICSGASMEWMIVTPQEQYTAPNEKDKQQFLDMKTKSTITRNTTQYVNYNKVQNPLPETTITSGDNKEYRLALELASPLDAIKGSYIYRTNKTTLVLNKGDVLDYLILGVLDNAGKIISAGNSPLENNINAFVSLVTGKTYKIQDNKLSEQGFVDTWESYKQSNMLSDPLVYEIEKARADYFVRSTKNAFGLFNLESVGNEKAGQFVYATSIKIDPDMTKGLQKDYIALVLLDQNKNIIESGLNLNNAKANGFVSLTTSYIYEKNTNPFTPPALNQNKAKTDLVSKIINSLEPVLRTTITNLSQTYKTYQPKASEKPTIKTDSGILITPEKETPIVKGGTGTYHAQESGDEDIDLSML